jgi:putative flippase GtrA
MIALRYALFALIASLANLAVQSAVFAAPDSRYRYGAALIAGTGTGLVVKYLLDRRWIFFDRPRGLAAQGRQFTLYSLTGVATTLIFWACETAFFLTFNTPVMARLGGALGLAAGYYLKYRLDRRFVFNPVVRAPPG